MRNTEFIWYKLSNVQGFGAKSIHYIFSILLNNNLSITELFKLNEKELNNLFSEIGRGRLSKANFFAFQNINEDNLFEGFNKLKEKKAHIIGLDDVRYPKTVFETMKENAPPILYCKGYLPLLNTKGFSIVGSRDVDDFAIIITKSIAAKLVENGLNITSGYAKGVDTSAHIGALEAGGTTTMILSFGINQISIKKEMSNLDWERNSLFVTQFSPDAKFSGQNAMMRNKLVCAMSKAIIVIASGVERDFSGKMSGTFDAAQTALKMNIPVFVLNPEILKSKPQGNYDLIKLGGIPFSNGNEIINFVNETEETFPNYFVRKEQKTTQLSMNL